MAISVVMPALEMAQENGKLLAWRKKEGDSVTKGEPLLEIETDKAVVEVEAPGDGILAGITADDRVIFNGVQRVRNGVTVSPKDGDMDAEAAATASAAAASALPACSPPRARDRRLA